MNDPAIAIYLESVRQMCPNLPEPALADFTNRLRVKHLRKREHYLHQGEIQTEAGFLTKGLIRAYYVDQRGDAKTVRFIAAHDYAVHYSALLNGEPGKYHFQCLEETTIVGLPYEAMQWAYHAYPGFERYGRLIAERILQAQQARIESFLFQTAEERYLEFISRSPGLFQRVSVSHLCSYLGIERQTLTRIRQKLSKP